MSGIPREAAVRHRLGATLSLLIAAMAPVSCGESDPDPSLRVSVSPDPIPVRLETCAGVFAAFPCSRKNLLASFTVSVSANEAGGQGSITVVAVDPVGGDPLPDQGGSVSGEAEFTLAPNASAAQQIEWDGAVPESGPGRDLPPRLAFRITVDLAVAAGGRITETVTVLEETPRSW
jgi:hypothetical protein